MQKTDNLLQHNLQNKKLQETILSSINSVFPIVSGEKTMTVENLRTEDKLDDWDFPKQRKFKMQRKSWQNPIYGDVVIRNTETGKVLSKKAKTKLGNIPAITNRFTTIIDGNEYQTINQLRRKSGIYSRVKKNGELESEFNLEKGYNFKMMLDPETQLFVLIMDNRKYRLWTLLNLLGVLDSEIAKTWGHRLLEVNKKGALNTEVSEITSIYKKVYNKEPADFDAAQEGLRKYFTEYTKVDPETTKMTLGESFENVTGEALLSTSKKLLAINKGNDVPDERDSLIFKRLYAIDDLLVSHLDKQKTMIERKLARTMNLKNNVGDILGSSTFGKPIKAFFTSGDLSATPPQTNPVTIVEAWRRTTPMGTGGIQSRHSITMETRDVQPSHLGYLDPTSTPESGKVGITVGLGSEVIKLDNDMATPVVSKTGEKSYIKPIEFFESIVGYPDQYDLVSGKPKPKKDKVSAMKKGKLVKVDPSKIDYYIRSPKSMFSFSTNLVPFLQNTQGNRASTGARMITQAMSLVDREEPLVQTRRSDKGTYEKFIGSYLNPVLGLDDDGKKIKEATVTKVTSDYVHMKTPDGEEIKRGLYKNFPLNQDGFLNSTPLVKEGDKVTTDTQLADNNYTKDSILSLGKNLTVAYMPWKGYNFEDGAVITESAAKKLSHQTIHKVNIFFSPKISVMDKSKFTAWYPSDISSNNLKKLDERGLPKVGQKFLPGEILAAYLVEKEMDDTDRALKKLDKHTFSQYNKKVSEWDEDEPGIVTDVQVVGRNIDIYIKSVHPFKEGDKVSARYGNKSIVTKIIPDSEAPHRTDGTPVEVILNPHGVPSRMNLGQILETASSKIAKKTGKPFIIDNFEDPDKDMSKEILDKMTELGIEPDEMLKNGINGKEFPEPIFVGDQYFIKLRHIIKKKQGVHNYGSYDIDDLPVGKGAQKVGVLDTYSYLAHGAKANLNEITNVKGRENEEYWRNLQLGLPPVPTNKNFVFDKLMGYLKGAGVNVKKEGNRLRIMPLTDKETLDMSNGEITDPAALLVGKNLGARKNGLFDVTVTGGTRGTHWSHIKLTNRIPNPMYADAIMKVLNLTEKKYADTIAGKYEIDGATGSEAILGALKKLNVKKDTKDLKEELRTAPPTNVNKLNRRIRYLETLTELGLKPEEAYTMKNLPVLPPVFRPIYPLQTGDLMVSDINKHYRDVGAINISLKKAKKSLTEKEQIEATNALYNSVRALQGFTDPVNYSGEKYKGILQEISGKRALIQNSAWAKRQDISARSTITVEPSLGINQVGIPKDMAYKMMKPFVIKDLKESGLKASNALKEYKDETPMAMNSLKNVMKVRPIILNRAPSLHKHSIQAFKPVIVEGKSIRLNPVIFKGFNSDLDGDQQICELIVFLLDKDLKNYYIKGETKYDANYFNHRKIMAGRVNTQLPYIKGGNYYLINLEDFPYQEDKLLGTKDHIEFYEAEKYLKAIALDEETGEFVLANVSGWSRHTDQEVWTITLKNKRQIIADDDPRAVYGVIPKTLEYIRNRPIDSKEMMIPYSKSIETIGDGGAITEIRGSGRLKKEIVLNNDFGYFVGCCIGDGWVDVVKNVPKAVNLAGIEKTVVSKWETAAQTLFTDELHVGHRVMKGSYGKSEKHTISSRDLSELILPLIGKGAQNKHLPPFWFSAPEEFKLGLLSGLLDTDGSIYIGNGKKNPQLMINMSSTSIRLLQEMQHLLLSFGISSKITTTKTPAGEPFWSLGISSVEFMQIKDRLCIQHEMNKESLSSVTPNKDASAYTRMDLVPFNESVYNSTKKAIRDAEWSLYVTANRHSKLGYISRSSAIKIRQIATDNNIELPEQWIKLVENTAVSWSPVESVENTGIKETGYDLTVPGYETFMSIDGVILSNTMSIMAPIGAAAVEEAKQMMPDKILFKHGDNDLMPEISQEYLYGLHRLSLIDKKTDKKFSTIAEARKDGIPWTHQFMLGDKPMTIGQYMINSKLPKELRDYKRALDGKVAKELLKEIGNKYPSYFSDVINNWKDLGAVYASMSGNTFSLRDLAIDRSYKYNLLDKKLPEINKLKGKAKIDALNALTKEVQKAQDKSEGKRNNMYKMLKAKSFTKADSVRQVLSMPGVMKDVHGNPIDIPVTKSYAEGLDTPGYFTTLYGVRTGTVDRSVNTQDTGALNKSLLNVTRRLIVTESDCGTRKGIEFPVNDKNVMDRFALETIAGVIKRNDLIDTAALMKLKKRKIDVVEVRSPLTCVAPNGVCQLCYGLLPDGEIAPVGTNVGILEGQALTERSTQLVMQTFHTGGVASAGGGITAGFPRLTQILKVPEKLSGKATLSTVKGIVKKIGRNLTGGFTLRVEGYGTKNDKDFVIPAGRQVIVSLGDKVNPGDPLSDGVIKPQELSALKSHLDAQNYLVDEASEIFQNKFYRKTFETVIRGLSDNAQVTSAPRDSKFLRGDKTTISYIDSINKDRKKEGLELIKYNPYFKSIETLNTDTDDWFTRITSNRVKMALTTGAARGQYANLRGKDPIPAYLYGDNFGKAIDEDEGVFY